MKNKKPLENPQLADKIGKYSYLKILWKDFKKELPPQGKQIVIIVKLKDGYAPITGEYLQWISEDKKDKDGKTVLPATTFKYVKFDSFQMPEIYWNHSG